ncbi:MAG: hypothetical protein HY827_03500 [Actinobacteria bacterium]|nr:hypothetical protein [Actinomycetota bacterium]
MATVAYTEHTLSDFLRKSGDVLRDVDERAVLLRRRDGADLILLRADHESETRETIELSAQVLNWLSHSQPENFADALLEIFPWTTFLPEEDRSEFASDFIRTLRACVSIGTFDALQAEIAQWRNTAYVWSKPELLSALQGEVADDGLGKPVELPVRDQA